MVCGDAATVAGILPVAQLSAQRKGSAAMDLFEPLQYGDGATGGENPVVPTVDELGTVEDTLEGLGRPAELYAN